jgi:hypothetical protein
MTRKEFLKISLGGLLGGLTIILTERCTSSESPSPPAPPAGGQVFTSTNVDNHTHTVTFSRSDVESPPANGITKSTSSSAGHSHSFSMTQAQLQTVNGGTAVQVSDSLVSGHQHAYTITKWF